MAALEQIDATMKKKPGIVDIREKPIVDLTPDEIEQLTLQERAWIYSYRARQRQLDEETAA